MRIYFRLSDKFVLSLKNILSRAVIALSLLLPLILITTRSYGNGWEHGAIPFEALVKALGFESPEMRIRAAHSLGARGQPEAVKPLLKCLAKPEKNPLVRSALYTALGELGAGSGIPALTACLVEETREELRSDCVTALGMIGQESTLPILLNVLKNDSSFLVQSSAVEALGNFSEEPAVQSLTSLVNGHGNRTLLYRAIRSLGRTGSPAAVKPLLKALSESTGNRERLLVVSAITNLRSTEAAGPLTALLNKTDDPQLRTQIVIALGAIKDGDTYATLIEMLQDNVSAVRYFAVKSLHEQGRREAVTPINDLSLVILGRLEQRSDRELLSEPVAALADLSFQAAALKAITDLDAPKGLPALLRAAQPRPIPRESATALKLADGIYRQRRAALYGLGYTGSQKAALFLAGEAGIADPDFRLRAVAVRSIGVLGFSDAVDLVIHRLNDPAAEVRWTAATVLGRLHDPKAVKPLIGRLSDINSEVRVQAALSLGYLDDPLAIDKLKRLTKEDQNQKVRTAAAYSLQILTK
jgi:HEAT repeat protein